MEDGVVLELGRQLYLVSLGSYFLKDGEGTFIVSNEAQCRPPNLA